jgi:predicted metal-dependent peptidase
MMETRIKEQLTQLVLSQPFFGSIALRLRVIEDPSCKTFWTDSVTLGYNPAYAESLNRLQIRGVIARAVMHVSNGHCWRMGKREPMRWSEATSYAVNAILEAAGFVLPDDVLKDVQFSGRSAEEVYAMLGQADRDQSKPRPTDEEGRPDTSKGDASASRPEPDSEKRPSPCCEVRPYSGKDEDAHATRWKVAIHQAVKVAQMRGGMPGSLEAIIRGALEPLVDWRSYLKRFAQESSATDYSWSHPNRRYMHLGLYMPSLHEEAVGDAVFVRDSSGSVFDETQAQFEAEILAMHAAMQPKRLIVIDCDTRVTQMQIFERGDEVVLKPAKGGGGSIFIDPFRRLEEDGIHPAF